MTDAETLGQFLGAQVLPGTKPALKHLAEQRFDDRLAAQAVIAADRPGFGTLELGGFDHGQAFRLAALAVRAGAIVASDAGGNFWQLRSV